MLDFEQWLSPISGASPSGENLRADPRFLEIEQLIAAGTGARDRGDEAGAGEAVDWQAALDKAEELRGRGRDLRLLVIVTQAHANLRALAGLADGLTLIARTLHDHWDTVHPALRAEAAPRDAARPRINALMQLKNARGLLGDLRRMAFFSARGLGPVTGADLERGALDARTVLNEAATGLHPKDLAGIAAEHEQRATRVRAACAALAETAPAELAALRESARAALAASLAVEAELGARFGEPYGFDEPRAPSLRRVLERFAATLGQACPAVETEGAAAQGAPEGAGVPAAGAATIPDRLASRAQVIACLDRIIEFYDRTEPASPVPYLARRMRRMVPMDFLQLMEDLAPSGLKEFRALAGLPDDRKAPPRTQGDKS